MTSKRLFFKLIKQDLNKRIWCPIIVFILFFLTQEVQLMVMIQNITEYPLSYGIDAVSYFNKAFLGASNTFDLFMIIFVAMLCAVSGFSYLHSKTQIDTYHSMPVGRFTLFASRFVAGALMFVVPYVIHLVISLLVGRAKGVYTSESFLNAMLSLGMRVLIFLIVYAASIMAVCLTGNIVISMIAVVVINIYSLVLELMVKYLFRDFLYSFTLYGYKELWAFSPIAMIIKLYSEEPVSLYRMTISIYSYSYLPKLLLAIVVYTIIAAVLYIKRESESAGRAIAFKWAEPIVKTMCVIPVSLFSGMFFSSLISNDKSKVWYIFGMVFGYVIVALLMEVIFRMDIKGIFKHKKQFLFNAACVALIFVIFRYDVLGYNTYVPNDSELQSCSVWLGLLDASASGTLADGTTYSYYSYGSAQYAFENMEIKGNPSVMELARKICTNDGYEDGSFNKQIYFGYNYIEYMGFDRYSYTNFIEDSDNDYYDIFIEYAGVMILVCLERIGLEKGVCLSLWRNWRNKMY
jgi:ABC-2 type transport system permease protein